MRKPILSPCEFGDHVDGRQTGPVTRQYRLRELFGSAGMVYDDGVQGGTNRVFMRLLTGGSLMDRPRQKTEGKLGVPSLLGGAERLSVRKWARREIPP